MLHQQYTGFCLLVKGRIPIRVFIRIFSHTDYVFLKLGQLSDNDCPSGLENLHPRALNQKNATVKYEETGHLEFFPYLIYTYYT